MKGVNSLAGFSQMGFCGVSSGETSVGTSSAAGWFSSRITLTSRINWPECRWIVFARKWLEKGAANRLFPSYFEIDFSKFAAVLRAVFTRQPLRLIPA
jgi:hypothetical protein